MGVARGDPHDTGTLPANIAMHIQLMGPFSYRAGTAAAHGRIQFLTEKAECMNVSRTEPAR